jgi:hypothetical protein
MLDVDVGEKAREGRLRYTHGGLGTGHPDAQGTETRATTLRLLLSNGGQGKLGPLYGGGGDGNRLERVDKFRWTRVDARKRRASRATRYITA